MPWRERSEHVVAARRARRCDALRAENDVVVIEGAGSPAEINLHASDYRQHAHGARMREARCLLVTDIDRGGAFAHLYGTWALLPPERARAAARLRAEQVPRRRGAARARPAELQQLTGVPTLATLPMWREHGLPEEDGVFDRRGRRDAGARGACAIAVHRAYPRISNLDEFQPLRQRARRAPALGAQRRASWPAPTGSCCPAPSTPAATWPGCARRGSTARSRATRRTAARVLGICGGLQMLGEALVDPHGVDGNAPGPGPAAAATRRSSATSCCGTRAPRSRSLAGAWSRSRRARVRRLRDPPRPHVAAPGPAATPNVALRNEAGEPIGWQRGNVLGLYAHGLFESPRHDALFGRPTAARRRLRRPGGLHRSTLRARRADEACRRRFCTSASTAPLALAILTAVLVPGFPRGLKGNPVGIRGCPAAVSENDIHDMHWPFGAGKRWVKEAGESRSAREPEDLPASGAGEKSGAGSTWSLEGGG